MHVVFDASTKTTSGYSLNDQLLAGPSLYPNLSTVISKFRCHRVAFAGDISKIFHGILLHAEEDYHRFLKCSPTDQIEHWRMFRLTFRVTSSPYLATQVLHEAAADLKDKYPLASNVILESFYVDDCLAGADTLDDA